VSTVKDLLHDYQHVIDELDVVTGGKGVFDVEVDGEMLYSKHAEGRHAEPGEVLARFRDRIVPDVAVYER
jgi:predicted Rdx family selenoprotein